MRLELDMIFSEPVNMEENVLYFIWSPQQLPNGR